MKKIKSAFSIFSVLAIMVFVVFSCESDADELGKQFFPNTANLDEVGIDIIAYNVDSKDSIKSDTRVLGNALLGVFDEPVFGMRKASYVTQLIPNDFSRDFGKNPVVDSVILQIIPKYKQDSLTTKDIKINKVPSDVDSIKTVSTYPMVIYGKRKISGNPTGLTIEVHEIGDFIGGNNSEIHSSKTVSETTLLGKEKISTNIEGIRITNANNPKEVFSNLTTAIRIKLDSSFFKTKIVDKQGQSELNDVASFIRYFKGLRISVIENDGFLFYFNPEQVSLTMHYSYDHTESDQTTTRKKNTLTFNLGRRNAQFSQFEFNRPQDYKDAMNNINKSTGDPKLYLQGSGGASAEFVIPDSKIQELKERYRNDKTGILSAKIRIYSDEITWNNDLEKPSTFTILQKDARKFMDDLVVLRQVGLSQIVAKDLNKNPAYYDLDITQTLKNIIEKDAENKPIKIRVGDFVVDSKGVLTGWNNTTVAYTPNRIVLVGSDSSSKKRVQLKVVYAKK